jgi:cysteine-S-conjugate beta-lyase
MGNVFDEEIERIGTNSVKWEFIMGEKDLLHWERTDRFLGDDRILPLWVADMDFRCPQAVIEALRSRVEHGIYGYSAPTQAFFDSVVHWMNRRHDWQVQPEWICITPGVVPALHLLVRTYLQPGDKVLIQPPVYYPFFSAITNNGCETADNALVYENGRYTMDFENLEQQARDPDVKMAVLCSPHNPVGRVWSQAELKRFGEICIKHNVLVVADEIHGDIILSGNTFTPFAKISPEFARNSIICTAPSKTFNLAGLQTSCIFIPDKERREAFKQTLLSTGLFGLNTFGVVALQAAYEQGEEWFEQVLAYINANLAFLEAFFAEHIPQIDVIRPEGTYLVWLDCRRLGLEKLALKEFMLECARVYLDDGYLFGPQGEGFERINIACPRSILEEALERIKKEVAQLPDSGLKGVD